MKTFSLFYRNFFSQLLPENMEDLTLGGIDDSLENEFKISDYEKILLI